MSAKGQPSEHVVTVTPDGRKALAAWLEAPNGSLALDRVTFEAVEGGGILVRTRPWKPGGGQ